LNSLQRVWQRAIYYYHYFLSSTTILVGSPVYVRCIPSYSIGIATGSVFSPLVVFPYVQRWLYTTDIVYILYSQHTIERLADSYKAHTTAAQSARVRILEALLLTQVAVRQMVFIPTLLVVLCSLGPRYHVA
jgi:hypothetical protein